MNEKYHRRYYLEHKQIILDNAKKYYHNNKDLILNKRKQKLSSKETIIQYLDKPIRINFD